MTDQKKPETLADDTLDQAAGGLGNFEIQDLVAAPEKEGATGMPTGKRQHKPLEGSNWVDKSSPLVFKQD